jgi:hypothetical protein
VGTARTFSEGQRAYEARRAAKAGMTLENWLDGKQRQPVAQVQAQQQPAAPAAGHPPAAGQPPTPRKPRATGSRARGRRRTRAIRRIPLRISRLLVLLRWIVEYGERCADALLHHPAGPQAGQLVISFRTADLAAILARIQRGLLIAAGLRAHLLHQAAIGRPVRDVESRDRPPAAPATATDAQTAARRPRARPRPNLIALPLYRMPTAAQIAEELRRRPLGAVLVDLCRDLGIAPGVLQPGQWKALQDAVLDYGGSLVTLLFREWGPPLLLTPPDTACEPRAEDRDTMPQAAMAWQTGPPG